MNAKNKISQAAVRYHTRNLRFIFLNGDQLKGNVWGCVGAYVVVNQAAKYAFNLRKSPTKELLEEHVRCARNFLHAAVPEAFRKAGFETLRRVSN